MINNVKPTMEEQNGIMEDEREKVRVGLERTSRNKQEGKSKLQKEKYGREK